MPEPKRIEIQHSAQADGTLLVKPVGTLDVFTFIKLKDFLNEASAGPAAVTFVVDLTEVDYIASSGWSVLMSRRQVVKRAGGNLVVFGMNPNLRRVYDSMRIDKMLPSAADHAGAQALLKEG